MEGFGVVFDQPVATRMREILERLYDTQVLYPGSGLVVSGSAAEVVPTIAKSTGRYGAVELAGGDVYGWMVDVLPDYTSHYVRATIWYTATGGSATDFDITASVTGVDKAEAGLDWATWSAQVSTPGPAATHGQESVVIDLSTDTVRSADHHSIFFSIGRDGTDSNIYDILITKVELLFYKAAP